MKVSVIVLAYNGKNDLPRCLGSVLKQDYPKERIDIIAVDNASKDGSADLIEREFPEVCLIRNDENLGFAGGNNIGIRAALERGAWAIILLNQDTFVASDWLSEFVKAAEENPGAGILQSAIFFADDKTKIQTFGNQLHFLGFGFSGRFGERWNPEDSKPRQIPYASGASMFIRREVIEKIGMLNEGYFLYHEDLEWSARARLAGYDILLAPKARTFHHYEFSRNKKKWCWMERNRLWYLFSVYKIRTLILIFPALFSMEIGVWIFALSRGWFRWKFRSVGGFIKAVPRIISDRRRIKKLRKIRDKELMKFMCGEIVFEGMGGWWLRIANIPFRIYWGIIRHLIFW